MKSRDFLHNYWENPADENKPTRYLAETRTGRTALLMDFCADIGLLPEHSVLEIGCNIGRNLNALWDSGYKNLSGIEINPEAVQEMHKTFPDMKADIKTGTIESHIRKIGQHDMLLSMTVLMHLHPSSEWVFEWLVKKAKRWLITFEDECNHNSERILSRQYKDIFEGMGMKCVRTEKEIPGMSAVYTARIFEK